MIMVLITFSRIHQSQVNAQIIKWYGSKEKAIDASVHPTESLDTLQQQQNDIYNQFAIAKQTDDSDLANKAVSQLVESYKQMFQVENARNLLLDFASGFLNSEQLAQSVDTQYGEGVAKYIAVSIQRYYGM